MKNIVSTLIILIAVAFTSGKAFAQSGEKTTAKEIVTTEFKVSGVCGMCKSRIENAALVKGVKYVNWDQETGIAKVVYKSWKISETDIHNAIAEAGHDTEKIKATEEQYQPLDGGCCDYRNGVTSH